MEKKLGPDMIEGENLRENFIDVSDAEASLRFVASLCLCGWILSRVLIVVRHYSTSQVHDSSDAMQEGAQLGEEEHVPQLNETEGGWWRK